MRSHDPTPAHPFNWEEVRQRLARLSQSLSTESESSAQRENAKMERRARHYAKIPDPPPAAGQYIEVLRFRLAEQHFEVETSFTLRTSPSAQITSLPGGPHFLLGVTNLQGQVLAVFDLRQYFGVASLPNSLSERPLIVVGSAQSHDGAQFVWQVDELKGVESLRLDELSDPLPAAQTPLGPVRNEYLRGVRTDAVTNETVSVIDMAAVLEDPRLYVEDSEAAPTAQTRLGPVESGLVEPGPS